ncbi:MAG: Asp-tRNA(Asn)/Glu-tRNA(Gln) amidotransferase subunit GatB [Lentisphaeria bacterium]|nr:Asp-tRNA(Asn)/Glu-tRNA(Gln) amidotransferase subunit GatB [Lentisphaeria bacterium]
MEYEAIIGLEVHVQANTATKMFCACPNNFGSEPNTNVCPICLGYPGVLPTPNREAINKTVLAGLMLNCEIPEFSKFDRKAYWYPDMPKNYQITQYDLPFCIDGKVLVEGKALTGELEPKYIGITRIHLEEDVGKSTHAGTYTGVDYNRAGVPLMEIVSEPDMRTADEAWAYLTALRQTMQYAGVGNCDMEKGQMRCDVNISVRPVGQKEFNTKTEIKNLNSIKSVHASIDYEIERQIEMLENNEEFKQQTRGWNEASQETYVMREKEDAHDYRYFPEPDLMPVVLTADKVAEIKEKMPETPAAKRARFVEELGLPAYDAQVLCLEKATADWYETAVATGADPKKVSNWIMTELLRELSDAGLSINECPITPENLGELLGLIDKKVINGRIAKEVFAEMFKTGDAPGKIVKDKGLEQVTDTSAISEFVIQAIDNNEKAVGEYLAGKETALNFLVGQVMRFSRGKANPNLAQEALKEELAKRG